MDLGCGDNIVNPNFTGVDKRQTKYNNIIAELDDLSFFKNSSAKIIFSRRSIQHVDNDLKVFEEINRILVPDGIAVIEVASVWNAFVSKFLNYLGIKKYNYTIFHTYSRNGLKKKLEQSGLKIVNLGYSPTKTFLFRNHVAVCCKGSQKIGSSAQ